MKEFGGPVLLLDRADINTDEIIPAKYLTEISKEALGPHLLEDLKLEGFDPAGEALRRARVIVARENFGCGSSREHAPWALEVNGITAVIAPGFARIFRQNMFNCGMMAVELPPADVDRIFREFRNGDRVDFDLEAGLVRFTGAGGGSASFPLSLEGFDRKLVESGGWVGYADSRY